MNRLSDDARALIDAARGAHEPTARDRALVRRALAVQLPASAAAATVLAHTANAGAATAGVGLRAALVFKWLAGGALIGSVSVGAVELATTEQRATTSVPVLRGSVKGARTRETPAHAFEEPRVAVQPVPRAASVDEPRVARSHHAGARAAPAELRAGRSGMASIEPHAPALPPIRAAFPEQIEPAPAPASTAPAPTLSSTSPASAPASSARAPASGSNTRVASRVGATLREEPLLAEARALREAHAALGAGRAERALELVEEQSRRFPSGSLREERNAVRLLARCALGRASGEEVSRFLELSGSSPVAGRVRSACGR